MITCLETFHRQEPLTVDHNINEDNKLFNRLIYVSFQFPLFVWVR